MEQEKKLPHLTTQQKFVSGMLAKLQATNQISIYPLPTPVLPTFSTFSWRSGYIASGVTLEENVALVVHLSACNHSYHTIYFAVLCHELSFRVRDCGTILHEGIIQTFTERIIGNSIL